MFQTSAILAISVNSPETLQFYIKEVVESSAHHVGNAKDVYLSYWE